MNGDIRRLYIVRTNFSSANQRESTEKVDDRVERITLKWPKEVRERIKKVRNEFLKQIRKPALNFYGLRVIREKDKDKLMKVAEEANKAMHDISTELGARVAFIPLYLEQEAKGEVYQQVLGAIQSKIYGELFDRLTELAKLPEIPKRSRTALIKTCDRLKKWNVVDDPNIERTLNEIKMSFEADVFKPVLADLKKEMDSLKERGAFLEFEEE